MKPLVTKITQTNFVDPAGNIQLGYAVVFTVGTQGPFTITVPQDKFSAAEVNRRTQDFATELAQIPMQG